MRTPLLAALALVATFVSLAPARAAESGTEARLRDALRAATAQLQALEEERARWQATDAAQKRKIEALEAKLASAPVRAPRRNDDGELAELRRQLAEQTEGRAKASESFGQCQGALREATEAARGKEDERARLAGQLGPLNDRLSQCVGRNERMYAVARGIVDRYQKMSLAQLIRDREPILGFARVQLENLAQDDQDRLLEQRVKP